MCCAAQTIRCVGRASQMCVRDLGSC
jgi:hypothetical protein